MGGLGEAVGNAALAEQVTQHEQADKRRRGRQHEGYEYGDHDGEYYLFLLGYRPQLLHLYPALFLCRQRLHYRGLYDRNQRHVRISRDGDRTEKIRSEPQGNVNRRRAVCAADYAYGACFSIAEAKELSAYKSDEDAELRSRAHKQALGVGDQGTEVCHCSHAHEYQRGVYAELYAQIQVVYKAGAVTQLRPVYGGSRGSNPFTIARYSRTQEMAIIIRHLGSAIR